MRVLISEGGEKITAKESKEIREEQETTLFGYLIGLVDEATDDEEERANAKVNLAGMIGKYASAVELNVILEGEDIYLDKTFGDFGRTVEIVEEEDVEEDTDEEVENDDDN